MKFRVPIGFLFCVMVAFILVQDRSSVARYAVPDSSMSRLLLLVLFNAWASDSQLLVQTDSGPVQGFARDGVRKFLGVPFAASTAPPNRFKPPKPATPWVKTLIWHLLAFICICWLIHHFMHRLINCIRRLIHCIASSYLHALINCIN